MAINYPSLAELLAAYKNTGVADGINQASTNFNQASQVAGQNQNFANQAAAKQRELAIAQQGADTARMAEQAKYIDPRQYETLNHLAPGSMGDQPINLSGGEQAQRTLAMLQEHKDALNAALTNKQLTLAQIEANAQLGAKEKAAALQANQLTTAGSLAEKAVANVQKPSFFSHLPLINRLPWAKQVNQNEANSRDLANSALSRYNALSGGGTQSAPSNAMPDPASAKGKFLHLPDGTSLQSDGTNWNPVRQ